MSNPVGAVTASNPQKGVKRNVPGNPTGVPGQLPGFRGRVVDAGGPVKAPKLRNGNLNNETSNVRIPYSRVCPLEFLSSYTGRLSPGDVVFVSKFPPGFIGRNPTANHNVNNMTLGVNSMTRVVGLDGLNRLLMGSNPEGWKLGLNVMWLNKPGQPEVAPSAVTTGGNCAKFALSVLDEYRLDGLVISNDEPGAFTSSGSRDNAIFNVAVQGPTECNNGFLTYETERDEADRPDAYNPLTGITNARAVESYARGSVESGQHLDRLEGRGVPGRVGSPWLPAGKTDFVANFCGTYSQYPVQMWDRRVETLNTLYLGLRAYDLSTEAKLLVVDERGNLVFGGDASKAEAACMVFFQYMPFSSRVSSTIQSVTDMHMDMSGMRLGQLIDMQENPATRDAFALGRLQASRRVRGTVQRSALQDLDAPFDQRTFDPIRTVDLYNMVGAYHVGRVLDTKAARHDPYAGGPGDTAFSCIVDVGISWRAARPAGRSIEGNPDYDGDPVWGGTSTQRAWQQDNATLTNCAQPHLGGTSGVIGRDFGLLAASAEGVGMNYCTTSKWMRGGVTLTEKQLAAAAAKVAQAAKDVKAQKELETALVELEAKYWASAAQQAEAAQQARETAEKELAAKAAAAAKAKSTADAAAKEKPFKEEEKQTLEAFMKNKNPKFTGFPGTLADPMEPVRNEIATIKQVTVYQLVGTNASVQASREAWAAFTQKRREIRNDPTLLDPAARAPFIQAAQNTYVQAIQAELRFLTQKMSVPQMSAVYKGVAERWQTATANKDHLNTYATKADMAMHSKALFLSMYTTMLAVDDAVMTALQGYELPGNSGPNTMAMAEELMKDIGEMRVQLAAFGAECDVYACHFHHFHSEIAKARAPAPTGSKAPAATSRARSKSPAKRTAPPAAAAGMTSMPLVPTSASPVVDAAAAVAASRPAAAASTSASAAAGPSASVAAVAAAAAPRRRAREGAESTTNSVFATMFSASSPTAATPEEPVSPTPSSGSDQAATGPRTFRRGPQR